MTKEDEITRLRFHRDKLRQHRLSRDLIVIAFPFSRFDLGKEMAGKNRKMGGKEEGGGKTRTRVTKFGSKFRQFVDNFAIICDH